MNKGTQKEGRAHWSLLTLGILTIVLGVYFLAGGGWLIALGGSWYYGLSGILLIISGIQIIRGRLSGAWLYALFYLLTIIWSSWESGSNYWGWVPRLGLVTVLAFLLTLVLPRLGISNKSSKLWLGSTITVFLVAFVLSFIPYNVTPVKGNIPNSPLVAAITPSSEQEVGDWKVYGRDEQSTRYSPLEQINTANVGDLERVWVYRTGDLPPKGKPNKWAAETTPIKVDGGVFLCTATNDIIRIDPASGKEVWRFKSQVQYRDVPYTAACRGVTYYKSKVIPEGDACHTRIVEATLNMRLIAVDANTGKLCRDFGDKGQVNLLVGMGDTVPGFLAVTAPPPIINGTIVVNHQVLDGQRRWAPSGVIRGYNAENGKFEWAWDVNRPNESGEPPAGKSYSRGTPNSWTAMVGDDQLGLVYVPTGNSAADYYSATRSDAENEVSSAIVALDAANGKVRWVFQTVHKDVWDYDMGSQPTLIDYPAPDGSGKAIQAMIVPTKRGQTFVIDRSTGKPLTPVEERPAPPSVVKGDPRAPTQPWSVGMPRLGFPDLSEKKMWGMTPLDQLYCRIKFRQARYEGEFTSPSQKQPWIEYPGYNGGSDWGSVAFNPQTGILIANWNNTPMYNKLLTREEANDRGLRAIDDPLYKPGGGGAEGPGAMEGTPYGISVSPFLMPLTKVLCNEPPYGMITAIDMHKRKVIWQRPLGTARANGPFGLPTYMPIEVGTPNNGGPIITAGGLTFIAAATDNLIRAIDMKTGKVVWSDVLPAGGQATPMTYEFNGRQYLVIMAGGHHFMETPIGDYVVAYALPVKNGSANSPKKL